MKFSIYKTVLVISAALVINGCTKQEIDPLMDARADVPVSITNAAEFRPDPTVTCSLKDSIIQIVLSIPAQSGKTITEITKIATTTSYTKIQGSGSAGFYVATAIPVNGTSYTYKTTLKDYFAFNAPTAATGANPPAKANAELGNRFYFLIKLSDGTQIVTMPVRVLVLA